MNMEIRKGDLDKLMPAADFVANATICGMQAYHAPCAEAERDYAGFRARLAREHLVWQKPFTRVLNEDDATFYKWFEDGHLNVSCNGLDRNLQNGNADKTAIIFEGDDGQSSHASYKQLDDKVCKLANGLKSLGIQKCDRVIIYMAMSVEGVAAMQACARIGATHSIVFGGFSAKSLQECIIGAGTVAVITSDQQLRGGTQLFLKSIVDEALALGGCATVKDVIVDEAGQDVPNGQGGILVVKRPWPSMIRTIWNNPERFKISCYPEQLGGTMYLAGDGAIRNKETGYFTITGRIDDVLNVSGHQMGTILRRLLRVLATGETITQDVSTLEKPAIFEQMSEAQ